MLQDRVATKHGQTMVKLGLSEAACGILQGLRQMRDRSGACNAEGEVIASTACVRTPPSLACFALGQIFGAAGWSSSWPACRACVDVGRRWFNGPATALLQCLLSRPSPPRHRPVFRPHIPPRPRLQLFLPRLQRSPACAWNLTTFTLLHSSRSFLGQRSLSCS